MIKVEVLSEQKKTIPFPKRMRSKTNGIVVMFADEKTGMVIEGLRDSWNPSDKVGHYSDAWNPSAFEDIEQPEESPEELFRPDTPLPCVVKSKRGWLALIVDKTDHDAYKGHFVIKNKLSELMAIKIAHATIFKGELKFTCNV